MPDHPHEMTPWDFELLGVTLPPSQIAAAEELEEQRRAQNGHRRQSAHAAQIVAWPELYTPAQGGTAGDTVDLPPLWERAFQLRAAVGDVHTSALDLLAEDGGGLARRLRAGLLSLQERRDGNVALAEQIDGDTIAVTIWSKAGCWSRRSWWGRTTIDVAQDIHGEVRMTAPRAEFLVGSQTGECTRFTDHRNTRSCGLGGHIVDAYRAWLARAAIRDRVNTGQPAPAVPPITRADFVREVQAHS